jgi:hypothetical protein
MSWRRVLGLHRSEEPPPPGSSAAELREAKELQGENRRHIDFIERHVSTVSKRIRADARAAQDRFGRMRRPT